MILSSVLMILQYVIGPVTAAIIAYMLATRDERSRRFRDHVDSVFGSVQKDVSKVLKKAIEYYSTLPEDCPKTLELEIQLLESDIRSGLLPLKGIVHKTNPDGWKKIDSYTTDFLSKLTGANFGVAEREYQFKHCRLVMASGIKLKSSISDLRKEQFTAKGIIPKNWRQRDQVAD